jgi:hypothetical protein
LSLGREGSGWDGKVAHDRPQEADKLTRDRDNGNLRQFPIGKMLIPLMEPLLRLPCMGYHGGRLALLASPDLNTEVRPVVIAPRRLDQDVSAVTIPCFRDRALSFTRPTGVLPGDEPEIRGELARPLKPARPNELVLYYNY